MTQALSALSVELVLAETALLQARNGAQNIHRAAFGGDPDQLQFKLMALDYLSNILKLPAVEFSGREADMRLRVALHFACPEAIAYDSKRAEPRWRLIEQHISAHFQFAPHDSERLARLVAIVLDNWDISRTRGLERQRVKILERQNYKCACCHLDFRRIARIEEEESAALDGTADLFKPYFDGNGVRDAMAPQVDHIYVISRDGTNSSDNLQVLCALCNQGKGDGGGIRPNKEWLYGHLPVGDIPRMHRMALLYYRLKMDSSTCNVCDSTEQELTIRHIRQNGLIILTNLRSICKICAAKT